MHYKKRLVVLTTEWLSWLHCLLLCQRLNVKGTKEVVSLFLLFSLFRGKRRKQQRNWLSYTILASSTKCRWWFSNLWQCTFPNLKACINFTRRAVKTVGGDKSTRHGMLCTSVWHTEVDSRMRFMMRFMSPTYASPTFNKLHPHIDFLISPSFSYSFTHISETTFWCLHSNVVYL